MFLSKNNYLPYIGANRGVGLLAGGRSRIRTCEPLLATDALAVRCLRPLGHSSEMRMWDYLAKTVTKDVNFNVNVNHHRRRKRELMPPPELASTAKSLPTM